MAKPISWPTSLISGFCVLVLLHLGIWWSAWQPWGVSETTLILVNAGFSLVALLVFLGSAAALVVSIPLSLAKTTREGGKLMAVGAAVTLAIGVADLFAYRGIFDVGAKQVVARGDAVVSAIRQFERDHGRHPRDLNEIVPSHLASLPSTGAAFSPDFSYSAGDQDWTLIVGLTQGPLDDTLLICRSDEEFEASWCSTRYGAWQICG